MTALSLFAAPALLGCGERDPAELGEVPTRAQRSGGRDVGSVVGRERYTGEQDPERDGYPSAFAESAQRAGEMAERAGEQQPVRGAGGRRNTL